MAKDDKRTLTPKLRFPEFRKGEGWEDTSLGQVVEFRSGGTPSKSTPTFWNGLIPWVTAKDMKQLFLYDTEDHITTAAVDDGAKQVPAGTVLMLTRGMTLLKDVPICVLRRPMTFNQDVKALHPKETLDSRFFPWLLLGSKERMLRMVDVAGHGTGKLNTDELKAFGVALPSPAEQKKIADCLTSLDELIATQKRKVVALKVHKKGLMQQFFPREGETFPRLRFPEFRDGHGWNKRRLGDFISERCEIADGLAPLFSLTIEDGVTAKTDRYERSFLVTNKDDAYKLVFPNDFALNPMNLRFGAIGRHSGAELVALSKYYNIFYCDKSVDPRFCEIYFRSDGMVAYYDVMATGSLIEKRRVHFDRFLNFSIPFPQIEEQRRIADCLSTLGARITAEADKLAALKTHKKGLLQQLFPSPEGD